MDLSSFVNILSVRLNFRVGVLASCVARRIRYAWSPQSQLIQEEVTHQVAAAEDRLTDTTTQLRLITAIGEQKSSMKTFVSTPESMFALLPTVNGWGAGGPASEWPASQ